MNNHQVFTYTKSVIRIPLFFLISIWLVYIIEISFGFNFNKYGVHPRTVAGLKGIFFSPFIHSNVQHLFNNSVPLIVMLAALYYFYYKIANKVLFYGLILTGLLTWVIGRSSYHIGASGIVYMLVSFIFFSGVFRKHYRLVALSLVVVFLYGSTIWYVFPVEERISWEGHLSGFVVGFLFAVIFRKQGPQPELFEYSENKAFEELFDEEGNFNPPEEEENVED